MDFSNSSGNPNTKVILRLAYLVVLFCGFIFSFPAYGLIASSIVLPSKEQISSNIKKSHPRLLLPVGGFAAIKSKIESDSQLTAMYSRVRRTTDQVLNMGVSTYYKPDGIRLLSVSRQIMNRTYQLAFAHKMEGGTKYKNRLWAELRAAASFPDWNAKKHFLDAAEMAHGFGIAYDWMYDEWTPEQRDTLIKATQKFGFIPVLEEYQNKTDWTISNNNWNFVCNAGMSLAALAMLGEDSGRAVEVLEKALLSLRDSPALQDYAPDGGWSEGPVYWDYGTGYLVLLFAGLESAFGKTFGFEKIEGFSQTGAFPLYASGPEGATHNFADAEDLSVVRAPCLYWLARTFQQPAYAIHQNEYAVPQVRDLLFYIGKDDPLFAGKPTSLPLDGYFRNVEYSSFRSEWNNKQATYFGFKAGHNQMLHGHLDLGSFVIDALGERWAGDLGGDNYNLSGYFDEKRFNYYRTRAEGNNTFILNPGLEPDQDPEANTKIIQFKSGVHEGFALADLSPAYTKHAQKVQRGMALINQRKWILLQDEVTGANDAEGWWFMHTKASIQIQSDSLSAILTLNGKRMYIRILTPDNIKFRQMDAAPLPTSPKSSNQNSNVGWKKLAIGFSGIRNLRLSVVFIPLPANETIPTVFPEVYPFDAGWPTNTSTASMRISNDYSLSKFFYRVQGGRIEMGMPGTTPYTYSLLNLSGYAEQEGSGIGKILLQNQKSGIYILRVYPKIGQAQQKMVLIPSRLK